MNTRKRTTIVLCLTTTSVATISITFMMLPVSVAVLFASLNFASFLLMVANIKKYLAHPYQDKMNALGQLLLLADKANTDPVTGERWAPDFNDWNQKKWSPVFVWGKQGAGLWFDFSVCTYAFSEADGGLCFKDEKTCGAFAQEHIELFRVLITYKPQQNGK